MTARFSLWVKKQPLVAFYLLAFAITWLGWVPQALHSRGLFPFDSIVFYILDGTGPLLALFIVTAILKGKADFGELFLPLLQWRVSWVWYVVAFLGFPALWLAALAWRGELATGMGYLQPSFAMLQTFVIAFVAAIPEEMTWRGFTQPRLQTRYTALVASLIIGVLWGLWHLPLLLNLDSVMSTYPLPAFFAASVALNVVYVWIFNSTRGSLLIITLFHAVSNTLGPFAGYEQAAVYALAAAVLVLVFGAARLARPAKPLTQQSPAGVTGPSV
ncbi:MAG TPA: CPBP family intramembrane glutamic endopeptidase [Anaerolineaceae bacterium]|nr:CPBP family intramembrane glutamic endopeptidase [Anaerolineaceae bacterium]